MIVLLTAVAAAGLSGCAPTPDVSESAAARLQASVQVVAGHAAAGDPAAAVAELDALQTQLDAAVQSGDVADERSETIQTKLDLVRADLVQLVADKEAAAQAAADAQAAEDARIAAEKAEADRVAAEQAEAQRQADEKAARENGKPGKGPGKNDEGPED